MKTFSKRQKVCFLTRLRSVFTWENAYSTECPSNLSSTCPPYSLIEVKNERFKAQYAFELAIRPFGHPRSQRHRTQGARRPRPVRCRNMICTRQQPLPQARSSRHRQPSTRQTAVQRKHDPSTRHIASARKDRPPSRENSQEGKEGSPRARRQPSESASDRPSPGTRQRPPCRPQRF